MNNNNTTSNTKDDIIAGKAGNPSPSEGGKSSTNTSEPDYKELYEQEQKKFKDTQKAFTKGQQTIKQLEKVNQTLVQTVHSEVKLTPEQVTELETLKYKDPDEWYNKKIGYETEARARLTELQETASAEGLKEAVAATNQEITEKFLAANPDLTLDMINLDVPQRIHNELDKGDITHAEFLEKSKEYILSTNKTLKDKEDLKLKDLNKVPGGATPQQEAVIKEQANKEIIF